MIESALCAARDTLRRRLGRQPNGEELVHITCPGRGVEGQRNYLGMMFIGMEHEPHLHSEAQGLSLDANLVFMLYADFSNYTDSLRFLSEGLSAFQRYMALKPTDFPDLKLPEYPLYVEPYFFPLEQHIQTWNPFMDDSIPFMFFKLRSLRFKTSKASAPDVRAMDMNYRKENP